MLTRFPKFVPRLFNVPYLTRLQTLILKSLEERRIINKLTEKEVDIPSLNSFKKVIGKINFSSYCRGHAFDV